MAEYDVNLTFEGDAAVAAQWAGYAKRKAREFGMLCAGNMLPYSSRWFYPDADIKVRVRYVDGIQKAHIQVSEAGGFVFQRVNNTADSLWWDQTMTRNHVIVKVSSSMCVARKALDTIQYGSWVSQENGKNRLTITKHAFYDYRSSPSYTPPFRLAVHRNVSTGDVGYIFGRNQYFSNGKSTSTNQFVFGVYAVAGSKHVLEGKSSIGQANKVFNSTAVIAVCRYEDGVRTVIGEHPINSYRVEHIHSCQFEFSPDGTFGVAYVMDSGSNRKAIYLLTSSDGSAVTFTEVTVNQFPASFADNSSPATVPYTTFPIRGVVKRGNVYRPVCAKIHYRVFTPGSPSRWTVDVVIFADDDLSGAFATEIFRVNVIEDATVLWRLIDVNLSKGLILFQRTNESISITPTHIVHTLYKIDFATGSYETFVIPGAYTTNLTSFPNFWGGGSVRVLPPYYLEQNNIYVQTLGNHIWFELRVGSSIFDPTVIYILQYTSTGYVAIPLQDVTGMQESLGIDPISGLPLYPATDCLNTLALLGTI